MLAIVLLASLLRVLLIDQHWPVTNSDEGVMDLMALHIANHGEHPIFFYGQDYMGALEAYIGAGMFQIFGASVFALRLGVIPFYAFFLISMYFLTRLLYSRRLALVTILLLSLGSSDIITRQLKAIGGYPETFFFAALIFLLASKIALSSNPEQQKRSQGQGRRWLLYGLLGFVVGLALWIDQLILPFIATTGLLLLLFCRRDLFSRAGLCALLGIALGALPLIYYNLTSPFEHNSLIVLMNLQRSGIDDLAVRHIPRIQQLSGAFFISLPAIMALNPLCSIENFPLFGQVTAQNAHCALIQGGWSLGYTVLWIWAALLAIRALWRLWMLQSDWSCVEKQTCIKQYARLLLLLSAALSFALYATSPGAALSPATNTRYLICMLVALPAVLWPLWPRATTTSTGLHPLTPDLPQSSQAVSKDEKRSFTEKRWPFPFILQGSILLLIAFMFISGTIRVVADIPAAQETYNKQQGLIEYLELIGATRIYTDYWTCYRIAFQSNEKIICANLTEDLKYGPDSVNRYTPYYEQVQAVSQPTYVFPRQSLQATNFARQMQAHNISYKYSEFGDYIVYQFTAPIGIPSA